MDGLQIRRMLAVAFLMTASVRSAHPQVSTVQKFQIHMTDPAYTGLPIWIYAESSLPLEIHYPYGEDPEDFGPNRLEVKHENQPLERVPFKPWVLGGGILDGWIAPPSSPDNRLPLHLQYSLDKPGSWSAHTPGAAPQAHRHHCIAVRARELRRLQSVKPS